MNFGVALVLFGSLLMAFAVILLISGAQERGYIRTEDFTGSGPVWFIIFMFGAFLTFIGVTFT